MLWTAVRAKLARLWFRGQSGRQLRHLGAGAHVVGPFRLDGADRVSLGAGTFVQEGAWLYACPIDQHPASLVIGEGCVFGYRNHIAAVRDVVIGNRVLTANNVYISDNVHGFDDVTIPIMDQPVRFKGAVSVGDGSWLGENVCIIGARVGRNCVIGANAVVTRDIPDFSVAVGSPARVIRQYDPARGRWVQAGQDISA